ncbi:MAG: SlyX family protein [Pseudomonadota bacterium]
MQNLEEQLAHLIRTVDELSDVVAKHSAQIETLDRRLKLLLEREAEREAMAGGQMVIGDSPPPHY